MINLAGASWRILSAKVLLFGFLKRPYFLKSVQMMPEEKFKKIQGNGEK